MKRSLRIALIAAGLFALPSGTFAQAQIEPWYVISLNTQGDGYQFMRLNGSPLDRADAQDVVAQFRPCTNINAVHAVPESAFLAQVASGLVSPAAVKIACAKQ